jgi:hypothetical protein
MPSHITTMDLLHIYHSSRFNIEPFLAMAIGGLFYFAISL